MPSSSCSHDGPTPLEGEPKTFIEHGVEHEECDDSSNRTEQLCSPGEATQYGDADSCSA